MTRPAPAGAATLTRGRATCLLMGLACTLGACRKPPPSAPPLGPGDRIAASIDPSQVAVVPGSANPRAARLPDLGPVDDTLELPALALFLRPSDAQEADLKTLLANQQNPDSPHFREWLTPEQYGTRFGLTTRDLDMVTTWLQAEGFVVHRVSNSRNRVFFKGTAGQVQRTFHTRIRRYRVDNEDHFANATDVSVPRAIADMVLYVAGLNDFRPRPPPIRTVSDYTLGGTHFVVPSDMQTIYSASTLYGMAHSITGAGGNIAIMGQTSVAASDIANFRSLAGLPSGMVNYDFEPGTGSSTYVSANDQVESDLDIEWAGAIAENATINFVYTGGSSYSWFNAYEYTVDSPALVGSPTVISISYGGCEILNGSGNATGIQSVVQQGNVEGITTLASSGDSGAAACDPSGATQATQGFAVNLPASIPEITAVGGTTLNGSSGTYWSSTNNADYGSALSYIPEITWNDGMLNDVAASGGGASIYFSKPSWQTGTGVPADGVRDVPDVAYPASDTYNAYLICGLVGGNQLCAPGHQWETSGGGIEGIGGTSAASPLFAGILTLINQAMGNTGAGATGLGNINPTLYALANNGTTATLFHDVTSGTNVVPCKTGTTNCTTGSFGFTAGTGYDQVTGLGSMDAYKLWTYWPTTTTTTLAALPTSSSPGQSVTFTASISAGSRIGPAMTGTVKFYDSATLLGTITVTSATGGTGIISGSASYSTAALAAGTHSITAVYSGDSTYHTSTSSILTFNVTGSDFSLAASPASFTIALGATGASTISTALTTGSTQTIAWTVSGTPSGATATFSLTSTVVGVSTRLTFVSGTAVAGSYPLTVTGTGTVSTHTVTVTVTIATPSGGAVQDPGFESGGLASWKTVTGTATGVTPGRTGTYAAQLGSTSPTGTSTLAQIFTTSAATTTLSFWYQIFCTKGVANDWAGAQVKDNTTGVVTTILANTCSNTGTWQQASTTVKGSHSLTLFLNNHDDGTGGNSTHTWFDDVSAK